MSRSPSPDRSARAASPLRLFVAVELPPELRARLAREGRERFGALRAARLVAEEDLHVTVAFLGDTAAERVEGVCDALARAAAASAAGAAVCAGLGAFPSPARARVAWAGVREAAPLEALERAVLRELRAPGVLAPGQRLDERPYTPHVTLARLQPGGARQDRARIADAFTGTDADGSPGAFGTFPVTHVALFESPGPAADRAADRTRGAGGARAARDAGGARSARYAGGARSARYRVLARVALTRTFAARAADEERTSGTDEARNGPFGAARAGGAPGGIPWSGEST